VIVVAVAADSHALGKLQPADLIVAVDGKKTLTVGRLRQRLARLHPGDVVRLTIRRGAETLTVAVKTVADPVDKKRALVGFTPDQAANIQLPIKVEIDAGNVGGPSAGLPFALQVMDELGRDVDRGYKVAATGQINLDGTISPIGGVKQKTYGVRKTKADVFLVPAGDNAREARRYADGLRIIPVKNFPQALRALATLPPKG
jgi:PDZ domain-containing protein